MNLQISKIISLCLVALTGHLQAEDFAPEMVGKLPSGKIVFTVASGVGSKRQEAVYSLSQGNILARIWQGDYAGISLTRDGTKLLYGSAKEPKMMDFASQTTTPFAPNSFGQMSTDLSADATRIVLTLFDWQTGISKIQTQDIGGANMKTLLDGKGHLRDVSWSPDGSKILFTSTFDGPPLAPSIWVMGADGNNRVNISNNTEASQSPAWSHDGSHIAWSSKNPTKAGTPIDTLNITIAKSDGTQQKEIASRTEDKAPSWSPDGKWIAFASTERPQGAAPVVGLWIMAIDGSNRTEILRINKGKYSIDRLSWSK